MGLCKCRTVTNLFCFEHRKNVCEVCIVESHSSCIVKSYLQWLQDSDFSSNCLICSLPLNTKQTIRLMCLDVFHIDCLDQMMAQKPSNTTVNGYTCPSCQSRIIPPANQIGPLALNVKNLLSGFQWATQTSTPISSVPATTPNTSIPVTTSNTNSTEEHPSGIIPSSQFHKSQTAIVMDPDDPGYKQRVIETSSSFMDTLYTFLT